MATSASEIGSFFDCPICFENLKNPKYLPCLHTFCQLCLQSYIESHRKKKKKGSFKCPICRSKIVPPILNITAKEWAEQLPKNHQLLAFQDICQNITVPGLKVLCDSCKKKEEDTIAKIQCTVCKDNLCDSCYRLIHSRVKEFASHVIVDILSPNRALQTPSEYETCAIHTDVPIEVYCLDHDQLGCKFCLTTDHKDCKSVLALILDEKSEKKLKTPTTPTTDHTQKRLRRRKKEGNKISMLF